MFDFLVDMHQDYTTLRQGSISWVLPPALVDAYKKEGFFRLMVPRPMMPVLPDADESYQLGDKTLFVSLVPQDNGKVRLVMWVDYGSPYRRTHV